MKVYFLDGSIRAAVRVRAESEEAAWRILDDALEHAVITLGTAPDGSPLQAEIILDARSYGSDFSWVSNAAFKEPGQ